MAGCEFFVNGDILKMWEKTKTSNSFSFFICFVRGSIFSTRFGTTSFCRKGFRFKIAAYNYCCAQVAPLSFEMKTPFWVPAYKIPPFSFNE